MNVAEAASRTDGLITPRMAVGVVFFCFGAALGLWGGSVAEVARHAAVAPEVVGSAFLGYSVAGILGMAFAGKIGRAVSLRKRLLILLALAAVCLAALFQAATAAALIGGLFVFSFLSASVDLVMNSEALAVEKEHGRPVLSSFHGLASLGVGAGAILGSYLSVTLGLTTTAVLTVVVYAVAALAVFAGTPERGATQPRSGGSMWFLPSLPLIGLALVVATSIACELAATMFSAQTLTAQAPHLAAYAGAGATVFAFFQAGVRLVGDRLRAGFGDARLIRVSLAATTLGFVVVFSSSGFAMSAAGFAMIGVGTACIVPCGFAMSAGLSGRSAAVTISMVAIVGGLIRIPAPLVYGLLAQHTGFTRAFALYALLAAAALAAALVAVGRARIRRPA